MWDVTGEDKEKYREQTQGTNTGNEYRERRQETKTQNQDRERKRGTKTKYGKQGIRKDKDGEKERENVCLVSETVYPVKKKDK